MVCYRAKLFNNVHIYLKHLIAFICCYFIMIIKKKNVINLLLIKQKIN